MAEIVAGKIVQPEMVSPERALEEAAKEQRLEYEHNDLLAETKERVLASARSKLETKQGRER